MRSTLDLKDLLYFVTVYEEISFTRAAMRLSTVQSAVSDRIQRLEGGIGVQLFVRHHRSIVPTPTGTLLYGHAKRVFEQIDQFEGAVEDMRRPKAA
jgi:LysR family transcriptional regulator, benzoate and cis,cis-muconate-responsive activator of ben and cat genes